MGPSSIIIITVGRYRRVWCCRLAAGVVRKRGVGGVGGVVLLREWRKSVLWSCWIGLQRPVRGDLGAVVGRDRCQGVLGRCSWGLAGRPKAERGQEAALVVVGELDRL